MVKGHDSAVDRCTDHAVADGGVDRIRKIYGCCAGGQVYDITLGREHKHLVGKHVYLEVVEKVRCIRLLLALQ